PAAGAPAGHPGHAAHVVGAPLLRAGQHVVRGGDVLELLRAVRSGDVRVVLAGELAVRALDLIRAGVAGDAQDGVVIAHRLLSVGSQVAGICGWAGVPWSAAHESGQVAGDRADG